jgi:hypothetical protein
VQERDEGLEIERLPGADVPAEELLVDLGGGVDGCAGSAAGVSCTTSSLSCVELSIR